MYTCPDIWSAFSVIPDVIRCPTTEEDYWLRIQPMGKKSEDMGYFGSYPISNGLLYFKKDCMPHT